MRYRRTQTLEERLAEEATQSREQAKLLPPGALREQTIRRARQASLSSAVVRITGMAFGWIGSTTAFGDGRKP